MTAVDPDQLDDDQADDEPQAPPAPTLTIPPRKKRGICRVCGEPANAPRGSYCDEHAHLAGSAGRARPAADPQPTPRGDGAKAPPRAAPRVEGGRPSELEQQLRTMLLMAAQVWSVRDPICGGALAQQAKPIAEYWANQARASDRVRRALESLTSSGGILGAIAVHLPVLVVVFGHHVAPALQAAQQGPPIDVPEGVQYFADPAEAAAASANGNGQHAHDEHPDPFGWGDGSPAFTDPNGDGAWPDTPSV